MINASIKVGSGATSFRATVQAESIRRALSIAGNRYPGSALRVTFPIESETFFDKDCAAAAVLIEMPESVTG
jgi:hypothetical protein